MNSTCLPYFDFICSATSTTGPHTRDWQSCGVAITSATGFLPTTSANDLLCMSSGGWRVSIEAMSPFAEATVSVWRFGGMRSPTSRDAVGGLADHVDLARGGDGLAPSLVTARIEYLPGVLNGTWAA